MRCRIPSPISKSLIAIAAFVAVCVPTAVYSQVTFNGAQTSPVTDLSSPLGLAVDTAGNLYVGDVGTGEVVKETLAGGVYTQSVIATGVSAYGVAVDASGKVYIDDYGSNQVLLETPSGGSYTQSILDSGFPPLGIVLDAAGNLYIGGDDGNVYKETLSGGTYTRSIIAAPGDENIAISIDSHGNLYVVGLDSGNIFLETLSGGSYTQSTLFSGFSNPWGIAFDSAGNIYISDYGSGSVFEETLSGGSYTRSTLVGGLSNPGNVAFDVAGDLFIDESGNGSIVELRTSINFGTASIGSPTSLVALPFSINAGTTVGSVSVLTTGLPNKDFLDAGASTCTAKTYASTTNCVVNVLFSGRSPGSRRGAVVLADGAGNALATVPLTGTATGPQQEFFPSTATVINAATSRPLMLAVDGNSNVFIPDADNGQIVKVTSAGVSSLLASGLSTPTAVAVDGAGNLHVTNNGTSVTRITPSGTQNSVTVAGAANLVGIALDAAGNQYVTDQNTGKVFKIALNAAQSTFASGFASANGVAVDAVGNVYVSDTTGGTISKITPAGVKTSLATGLNGPEGLAVDAAGDVYYALSGTSTIGEVPLGGSPTALQANGSGTPVGLAIDSSGNLFFSDTTLATVSRLNRQIPPALAFAQTVAGGTSSDSPKSASMQNIGNAPLTIASVVYPIDFPEDDSGSGTDCVAGPLASASLCTFSVDFKPISAGGSGTTVNLLENIKVTSNNYNQPGILSRIITSGTETKVASTLVLSASNLAPTIGTSYTITASASGSGSTPTGTVTFYSGGSFLATGTLDGSGATILTPNLTTGTHTITATYGGDTGYSTASAPLLTVMVEKAVTSVSLESSLNPAAAGTPVTFTATVPTTVTGIAPTGKVMFYAGGVGIGSGTLLGNVATFTSSSLTTHTITAMYLGDRTYASVKSTVGIAEQITP